MKTTPLILLSLLLLASCCSEGPAKPGAPDATPPTLRVLAYNIHHGEGMDQRLDLERIAVLIKNSGADVVTLQEIDERCER
ncbi:MAG: hypothetical protein CMJ90_00500, partial [Planctomycetes bacterium]|nr:hypothetical protein [Planctomycetota bacterium]